MTFGETRGEESYGSYGLGGRRCAPFSGLSLTVLQAGPGHSLTYAAVFEKVTFERSLQLIEQIVGLMKQTDGDIGNNDRWTAFNKRSE